MKVRVILEKVRILDRRHPTVDGTREIGLDVLVRTDDRGGTEQRTRLPSVGHYRLVSPWSFKLAETAFEGEVDEHLRIRIALADRTAGQSLDVYEREFTSQPESWPGRYAPDQAAGPEHLGFWQIFYRIERVEPGIESAEPGGDSSV
ncbi:MAG TPA: hypothetical protein VHF25_03905 [Nitriliruptorales bacterium]|nr:hypothetical protein [Nitriliruptorales bacterium]